MAGGLGHWVAVVVTGVISVFLFAIAIVACFALPIIIFLVTSIVKGWWRSRRMHLLRLGGVTTLKRTLNYDCSLCLGRMVAGEKVRTLSCDHVFHRGGRDECNIDTWFLGHGQTMTCPMCRQIPQPVRLWKRPPASSPEPASPLTSSSSSSASSQPPSPRTPTSDSEELLIPTHWFNEPSQ